MRTGSQRVTKIHREVAQLEDHQIKVQSGADVCLSAARVSVAQTTSTDVSFEVR